MLLPLRSSWPPAAVPIPAFGAGTTHSLQAVCTQLLFVGGQRSQSRGVSLEPEWCYSREWALWPMGRALAGLGKDPKGQRCPGQGSLLLRSEERPADVCG